MSDGLTPEDRDRIRDRHRDDQFRAARESNSTPPAVAFHRLNPDGTNDDDPENYVVVDPRENVRNRADD